MGEDHNPNPDDLPEGMREDPIGEEVVEYRMLMACPIEIADYLGGEDMVEAHSFWDLAWAPIIMSLPHEYLRDPALSEEGIPMPEHCTSYAECALDALRGRDIDYRGFFSSIYSAARNMTDDDIEDCYAELARTIEDIKREDDASIQQKLDAMIEELR